MRLSEVFKPMVQAIEEALKPSEYRPFVKGWDKNRWAELFGGKYRIYLPLVQSSSEVSPNTQVVDFLDKNGFSVKDYTNNLAIDTKGREKRIGSIVAKDPLVKKMYDNDPARQGSAVKSNQMVVISRHPYDISSMSTDRGWTSCMNLHTGSNRKYIPIEIKAGTIIAYLVDKKDTNINNASARVLIKPFIADDTSSQNDDSIVLGIQDKVYGNATDDFTNTVIKWVDGVNLSRNMDGVFTLHPGVYDDSGLDKTRFYAQGKKGVYNYSEQAFKHIVESIDDGDFAQLVRYSAPIKNLPQNIINQYLPKIWEMSFYLPDDFDNISGQLKQFCSVWNTTMDRFDEFNDDIEKGYYWNVVPFYEYDIVDVTDKNANKLLKSMDIAGISYGQRGDIKKQIIQRNPKWKYYF